MIENILRLKQRSVKVRRKEMAVAFYTCEYNWEKLFPSSCIMFHVDDIILYLFIRLLTVHLLKLIFLKVCNVTTRSNPHFPEPHSNSIYMIFRAATTNSIPIKLKLSLWSLPCDKHFNRIIISVTRALLAFTSLIGFLRANAYSLIAWSEISFFACFLLSSVFNRQTAPVSIK